MQEAVLGARLKPKLRIAVAALILLLVFLALWQYRLHSAQKLIAAGGGMLTKHELLPAVYISAPIQILARSVNFFYSIWKPFFYGLLIAATLIALLPELLSRLNKRGALGSLSGAAFALPNMLCSCCAGPVFAGLYRGGASLESALSVYVGAPALNIAVLVTAAFVLPWELGLARIVLGLLAALPIPFVVAKICTPHLSLQRLSQTLPSKFELVFYRTIGRVLGVYCELLDLKVDEGEYLSLKEAARRWLGTFWRLSRVALPLTFGGIIAVEIFLSYGLFDKIGGYLGGGLFAVAAVAAFGTFIMIPSFTEIPLAMGMMASGMGYGPAAAILIAAPAVSFPSLLIVGWALRNHRVGFLLGVFVFFLSFAAGAAFYLAS